MARKWLQPLACLALLNGRVRKLQNQGQNTSQKALLVRVLISWALISFALRLLLATRPLRGCPGTAMATYNSLADSPDSDDDDEATPLRRQR